MATVDEKIAIYAAKLAELTGPDDKRVKKRVLQALGKLKKQKADEGSGTVANPKAVATAVEASQGREDDDGDGDDDDASDKPQFTHKQLKMKLKLLNKELADLAQKKQLKVARKKFQSAVKRGMSPDIHTYANLINVYVRCGDVAGAWQYYEMMTKAGINANIIVFTTLLKGFCEAGDINRATELLVETILPKKKALDINTRVLNTYLRGCIRVGAAEKGLQAYQLMSASQAGSCEPDSSTFEYLASLLCQALRVSDVTALTTEMATREPATATAASASSSHQRGQPVGQKAYVAAGGSDTLENAGIYLCVSKCMALLGCREDAVSWLQCCQTALEANKSSNMRTNMLAKIKAGESGPTGGHRDGDKDKTRSVELFLQHRRLELESEAEQLHRFLQQLALEAEATQSRSSGDSLHPSLRAVLSQRSRLLSALSRVLCFSRDCRPSEEELSQLAEVGVPVGGPGEQSAFVKTCSSVLSSLYHKYGLQRVKQLDEMLVRALFIGNSSASQQIRLFEQEAAVVAKRAAMNAVQCIEKSSGKINFRRLFSSEDGSESALPLKMEICSGSGEWVVAQACEDVDAVTGAPKANWIALELRSDRVYDILCRSVFTLQQQGRQEEAMTVETAAPAKAGKSYKEKRAEMQALKRKHNPKFHRQVLQHHHQLQHQKRLKAEEGAVGVPTVGSSSDSDSDSDGESDSDSDGETGQPASDSTVQQQQLAFDCIRNLAFIEGDASFILPQYVPSGCLTSVFINHPEPPERTGGEKDSQGKHLLTKQFFGELHRILSDQGTVTIVTDNLPYATSIMDSLLEVGLEGRKSQRRAEVLRQRISRGDTVPEGAAAIAAAGGTRAWFESVLLEESDDVEDVRRLEKMVEITTGEQQAQTQPQTQSTTPAAAKVNMKGKAVSASATTPKLPPVRVGGDDFEGLLAGPGADSDDDSDDEQMPAAPSKMAPKKVASSVMKGATAVTRAEHCIQLWRADHPGPQAGHVAANASSYFDRLWERGQKKRRWFLYLKKG